MDNITPVIVSFACLDDQVMVWNLLKEGCKTRDVTVTKDSRSRKEKEACLTIHRKVVKNVKKIDYHAHCVPDSHCDENHNVINEDDEFSKGDRALLIHGVESDWVGILIKTIIIYNDNKVEEEMMEDDVDFIRDVLETKVYKLFQNVGIQKKVAFINSSIVKEKHSIFRFLSWMLTDGRKVLFIKMYILL